jgi:hypothetical protein
MPVHLDAVSDDPAIAMLAYGRDRLNRAFEAIEGMPDAGRNQFESFVVIVAANFALCH